jgi:hypothetical protein
MFLLDVSVKPIGEEEPASCVASIYDGQHLLGCPGICNGSVVCGIHELQGAVAGDAHIVASTDGSPQGGDGVDDAHHLGAVREDVLVANGGQGQPDDASVVRLHSQDARSGLRAGKTTRSEVEPTQKKTVPCSNFPPIAQKTVLHREHNTCDHCSEPHQMLTRPEITACYSRRIS